MDYFYEFFPIEAEQETVLIDTSNNDVLPANAYALIEFCCTNPTCHCREMLIYVEAKTSLDPLKFDRFEPPTAVLKYVLRYPVSNRNPSFLDQAEQSPYAQRVRSLVMDYMKMNPNFVDQLHRHYAMMKTIKEHLNIYTEQTSSMTSIRQDNKTGRNEACSCGSGQKYKKCCLLKNVS